MAVNEKRPVLLRTVFALIVLGVFIWQTHPIQEQDFYKTFLSMVSAPQKADAEKLVLEAQARQREDGGLYDSGALLAAAADSGTVLADLVGQPPATDNRDVISTIRKKGSASIRRGIDLAGGVEFMMELVPDQDFLARVAATDGESREATEKRMNDEFKRYRDSAIEMLRKRLENNHIFESEIAPAGGQFISLKAPIVSKEEKTKLQDLLSMSAKLHFRLVHPENAKLVEAYLADPAGFNPPVGYELMEIETFRPGKPKMVQRYFIELHPVMDGKGIVSARPVIDQFNQKKIAFRFDGKSAKRFGEITEKNVGRQLAIVLDGKLCTAPTIQSKISDSGEITGQFTDEELQNISTALESGSFPFQIKVASVYDVDPTLGADNVANGVNAGIYGMILVVVFMIAYYLVAGVAAVLALACNVVMILGLLAAFDATLTLPGIAGIVLTIGMAVDANVLIFERIREELKKGKALAGAVDEGFGKAFSAVLDANLTTLFTGIILYFVGTGAIKGFAVTLCVGIVTSLFAALFLTRLFLDYALRLGLKDLKMLQLLKHPDFDWLGFKKVAFAISGALIIGSFIVMGIRGKEMLAVDLSGGTVMTFDYVQPVPAQQIIDALAQGGLPGARVAYKSSSAANQQKVEIIVGKTYDAQTDRETPAALAEQMLNRAFPTLKLSGRNENSVGGLVGAEFSRRAILAVILSFIGMIVYISLRYEFAYAMAAIVALMHDVIVSLGVFLVMGNHVSLAVIAAVLTTIGYSINDTIVIFDRIREDLRTTKGLSYHRIINQSINQTLNRTLITSITTFLTVLTLLIFGGDAIYDFVLLMLLGIVAGTFSSVCISSSLVALWHRKVVGIKESDTNFDEHKLVEE